MQCSTFVYASFNFRLDGFIVCEEHKDLLLAAWDEQQEIEKEKEAEVRVFAVFSYN